MNRVGLRMLGAATLDAVRGPRAFDVIAPNDRALGPDRHDCVCRDEHLSWTFGIVGLEVSRRLRETHAAPPPLRRRGACGRVWLARDCMRGLYGAARAGSALL